MVVPKDQDMGQRKEAPPVIEGVEVNGAGRITRLTPEGLDRLVEISREILVDQGLEEDASVDWKTIYPWKDLEGMKKRCKEDGSIDNEAFVQSIDYGIIPWLDSGTYLMLISYEEEDGSKNLALLENGFRYHVEEEQTKEAERWKKKAGINIGNLPLEKFKAL